MKFILIVSLVHFLNIHIYPLKEIVFFSSEKPVHLLDSLRSVAEVEFSIKNRLSDWSDDFSDIIYSIGIYKDKKINTGGGVAFPVLRGVYYH